ncbi:ATP-binding protein [Niveibacterium sp. 24ML]|uniref:AAA family ATPase n=1 Tax=Niveibacterium sp. 24ML TaxID=2985512 RepID=UPI00226F227A|nr:ATP-binding protein [Niveibacterium sp. 24ML]MCX9157831.1 ATP-binding protein [Niveibacterium sp. 24ML]
MRAPTLRFRNSHAPRNAKRTTCGPTLERYRPLLGVWALDLGLVYRAHENLDSDVVTSLEFAQITGLSLDAPSFEDDDYGTARWRQRHVRQRTKALSKARKQLMATPVDEALPLLRNVAMLAKLLRLTTAEQFLLSFAAAVSQVPAFRELLALFDKEETTDGFAAVMRHLSGMPARAFKAALLPEATLVAGGVLEVSASNRSGVDDRINLLEELGTVLLDDHPDASALRSRIVRPTSGTALRAADYIHLARDLELGAAAVTAGIEGRHCGVNVLLHGDSGTGKMELAKVLAKACDAELYEIALSKPDGSVVRGAERLRAYRLSQRLLRKAERAVLLFDEVDGLFAERSQSFLNFLDGEDEGPHLPENDLWQQLLEESAVPAIWVTERAAGIDASLLRAFDLAIAVPKPPRQVRKQLASQHLGHLGDDAWFSALAEHPSLTAAQFQHAARLAAMVGGPRERQREAALDSLVRSAALLGHARPAASPRQVLPYDLQYLNTSVPIEPLLDALTRYRTASLCLYGPPGTGKSELGRQLAERTGRPLLVKRASDILSKWVGEAERNIAAMFEEAQQENAVLLLDEADSFLANRAGAHRNWEVTQVNELLTQMERFEGIFVCTTNRIDQMDPASLRRFSHKIRFDPLTADQAVQIFRQTAAQMGINEAEMAPHLAELRSLRGLTPGDFAVLVRQARMREDTIDAVEIIQILRDELRMRPGAGQRMGFVG